LQPAPIRSYIILTQI
jgi:hypothetical protein